MTEFLRAAFTSVLLLMSAVAAGQTLDFTWTGDKNRSWDKPDNWTVNGKVATAVPGAGDNVTINPVTKNVPRIDKPSVTVNNFTINPNATLDMNGCSMTITGAASFAGGRIINSKNVRGSLITATGSTATFAGTSFGSSGADAVDVKATCAGISLNGSFFYGTATLEKIGATADVSNGGNTFENTVVITNSGAGDLVLNQVSADQYNSLANAAFVNSGTGTIRIAERAAGTLFRGNLTVSAAGQSKGIYFGQQGGTATLAAGKTISVATAGFAGGALRLKNFVQQGATAQTLIAFLNQAELYLETGTSFGGDATFAAPQVYLNGATFLGQAIVTKTGSGDNDSAGGNVFGGVTTIAQEGPGRLRMGVDHADAFNAALTLKGAGAGALEPAYNHAHSFAHNITIDKALTLGAGNATIYLAGSNPQTIGGAAAASVTRLVVNKPANGVLIGTTLRVTETAALQSGLVKTSSGHPLIIADNVTVTGASAKSFVSGPVQKQGDDAFVFPLGKGAAFRPVSLSAPATGTDAFTAEYFSSPTDNAAADNRAGLRYRCSTDYWQVTRNAGTAAVQVTLPLEPGVCPGNVLLQYLSILNYHEGHWVDEGGTFDGDARTITSTPVSYWGGYFTLGQPFYVLINASQVNATSYTVAGPGMTPVTGTSGANGTEQKIKPTAPAAGATDKFTIRIAPSTGIKQLDIEVIYDDLLLVKEVRALSPAGSLPLAPDYYEVVDGFNLYFRKERRQAARLDLRTNLSNGLYYNQGAGKFEVSLPNPALFAKTQLHVYRLDHPSTKVAVANPPPANALTWAAADATPGLYQFELELEDRQGTKKTYQGQFILKP